MTRIFYSKCYNINQTDSQQVAIGTIWTLPGWTKHWIMWAHNVIQLCKATSYNIKNEGTPLLQERKWRVYNSATYCWTIFHSRKYLGSLTFHLLYFLWSKQLPKFFPICSISLRPTPYPTVLSCVIIIKPTIIRWISIRLLAWNLCN